MIHTPQSKEPQITHRLESEAKKSVSPFYERLIFFSKVKETPTTHLF